MRRVHRRSRRRPRDILGTHVLTLRAIPRFAHVLARMPALLHDRSADVARESRALVDPHALRCVEPELRASLATAAIQSDELARVGHDRAERVVLEVAD